MNIRNALNIPLLYTNYKISKNSFFPSTITEWNKLDTSLRKAESLSIFKTKFLKFIRPSPISISNCHELKRLKFITRLRHDIKSFERISKRVFQESKARQNFLDIKSIGHFLQHCLLFVSERCTLLSTIGNINYKLMENTDSILTQAFWK